MFAAAGRRGESDRDASVLLFPRRDDRLARRALVVWGVTYRYLASLAGLYACGLSGSALNAFSHNFRSTAGHCSFQKEGNGEHVML